MTKSHIEPFFDLPERPGRPLDPFFEPDSVAVIGATERPGSVGRTLMENLIDGNFAGRIFPVNPKRPTIFDLPSYADIRQIETPVDLAVIVTPAPTVPNVIEACVEKGVRCAIIISAGFREAGAKGAELEREIQEILSHSSMRVIGPNCLGVMCPSGMLNATFAAGMVRPGHVAFISQSGALLTAILDWSLQENVGFSAFLSMGSMLDVGWGDVINYLCDDPKTHSIMIYMESIGDARAFLSAAREVTLRKPVIVIKAGRTEAASKAAASHTGSLTGSDEVLDAAFHRVGVLRVTTISDLFSMAEVLSKQPRPRGNRLTIVTNAGGPGVLATDALLQLGGDLTVLAPETIAELDKILPPHWSHGNPVDILGDADPQRYAEAAEIVAKDPGSDGMLVVLTPQDMTDPTVTAEKLRPLAKSTGKPLLASWMGGSGISAGDHVLNQANIPTFNFPDLAARAFSFMWQHTLNLRLLFETPVRFSSANIDREGAASLLRRLRSTGRTLLTEEEAKALLASYGIPIVATLLAENEAEAVSRAEEIGYPVVLKLHSHSITHKTDVGGVQLDLKDANEVRRAYQMIRQGVLSNAREEDFQGVSVQPMISGRDGYEVILGSSTDPQFGPVLLFGTGGQLVEVYKDRSLALPPLTTTLARRLMERTKIFEAFAGIRGRAPIDVGALEQLLVRFSWLVVESPIIKEIDINPLLVTPSKIVVLDARIVLHPPDVNEEDLPIPAIRPYPAEYVKPWRLRDGTPVTIRPIRPEDEPILIEFHKGLSDTSIRYRYFQLLKLSHRVAHERLSRLCFIDYDREMALVVIRENRVDQSETLIGVGRLIRMHGVPEAEFAVIVSDDQQRQGLGTEILRRLIEVGQAEGIKVIFAEILPENIGMQHVCSKLGFEVRTAPHEGIVRARLQL